MIDWSKVVTAETKTKEALSDLKKQVSAIRYANEVRGITVNGISVDTGRDSQGLIAGACLAAVIDNTYVVNWKCPDGTFTQLDSPQIIGLATAVRAHVQACFDREGVILSAISDNSFTDNMLTEGWPNG